uniref:Diacylglycerol kinase n=1 Tax=Macrostomum lignano TaxID=282301 RepID=A0A1I8IJW5_9PLAT
RTISEDWSSSGGDSTRDEAAAVANQASGYQDRRSPKDRQEVNEDLVKIYDGNGAAQRKQYRIVSIQRGTTLAQLTECALRVYHVLDDARLYTLVELNERDGSERRLDESAPLKQQFRFDSRRPAVVLRYREKDANRASIRVYPTGLQYVTVTKETTAQETIVYALKKFGVEQLDASQLDLVEVSLDKQVSERTLARDEKPLQLLHSVRRESVRQYMLTRFYIQPVIDPRYTGLALYVGNLKTGMSQRVYEKILMEKLGSENKWDSIDVIYYEYGAMVLVYKNPRRLQQAYNSLRDQWFDDKPMLVLLLPQLHPEMIPDGTTPVLVLVNVKSGGCQGIELVTAFRKLLNPHQVFNLDYGGPLPGLYVFRQVSYYKILVCGGDGTVGWALSCLDNVGPDAKCQLSAYGHRASGPAATDLLPGAAAGARALGPGRYCGRTEIRWTRRPMEKEKDETKVQLQYESNAANTNEDNASIFVMNNYFGIGLDADVSLDFHLARNENPSKFNSRFHNKGVYFKMSVRKMMSKGSCKDLHRQIIVEVDGKVIDLPPLEGIIILNILSWASGANPWGTEKDDNFNRPNHWDGQLEVVGVTGMVHMGQIFSGLRSGNRIAQGGHIKITLKGDIPVQIDGEPWVQSSGQVVVLRSALRASMLKKCKGKSKGRGALAEPSFYNLEPSQCPTPPPDEGATVPQLTHSSPSYLPSCSTATDTQQSSYLPAAVPQMTHSSPSYLPSCSTANDTQQSQLPSQLQYRK